jgi:mannose-6-phosphate isomerase-like protein (cupin superfamily)
MILRQLQALATEGLSHDAGIEKRVILRSGEVPSVTTFAQACFAPGQETTVHAHQTMYEIYLVESGGGEILVDGRNVELTPGVSVIVEPRELHQVRNTGTIDLVLTYFGIAAW